MATVNISLLDQLLELRQAILQRIKYNEQPFVAMGEMNEQFIQALLFIKNKRAQRARQLRIQLIDIDLQIDMELNTIDIPVEIIS